eukprot:TRINITY_DN2799_c0_g1_i1.p1 TRINITY_DN2799_c0_g1~~TRINITY_DN2799_c0_g1_i1.p1  ORF type:complete len:2024 (+),score=199.97 TRINITY_DN2799_c0_g1_i1:6077-12148(+)
MHTQTTICGGGNRLYYTYTHYSVREIAIIWFPFIHFIRRSIMATTLARQLMRLRAQQKDELKLPQKAAPSFLFDIADAARIDENTLYPLALSGLDYLSTLTPSLTTYAALLLSPASKTFNRFTQTVEDLKMIDSALSQLIKLLAPHFLLPSCHKVLEYLVRVYDVHVYHKELLMDSLLPFLESPLFVRIAQLLNLKSHPTFGFLETRVQKGNILNKQVLAKEIAKNPKVLERICNFSVEISGPYYLDFVTLITLQLINIPESLTPDHIRILLKYVSDLLKNVEDVPVESILAISLQLASSTKISSEYIGALFSDLVKVVKTDLLQTMVWKAIAAAVQSNENIQTLPTETIKQLYGRNSELMAKDHEQYIDEYYTDKYAMWLGTSLSNSHADDQSCEFLLKIRWSDKRIHFLTGIVTAFLKAKGKTTLTSLLKKIEAADKYGFCKWLQEFFAIPTNCTSATYSAFLGLRSFRAQFIVKGNEPIFPTKRAKGEWGETVLEHLETVDSEDITAEDASLYASIIKVICESGTEMLDKVLGLKVLPQVFSPSELLELNVKLCEETAEHGEEYKATFQGFCSELAKSKGTGLESSSKEWMILISGILDKDLAEIAVPVAEELNPLDFFRGIKGEEILKEKIVGNIAGKDWRTNLLALKELWSNAWTSKSVNNTNVAELFIECLNGLKAHYEFFLNDIIELLKGYSEFFLSISSKKPQQWTLDSLNEVIKAFPSLEDPRLSLTQQQKIYSVLESVYTFFVSHKECYKCIAPLLNKHFKTQCAPFHLYLLFKYPQLSDVFLNILSIILKDRPEISCKLPLLFGLLISLNSEKEKVRKAGIGLAKTLSKCNGVNEKLTTFWKKIREWVGVNEIEKDDMNEVTNDILDKFVEKILKHEDEIILDKDQILSHISVSTKLAGYLIEGALYLPVQSRIDEFYLLFTRSKHSELCPHLLKALARAEACGELHSGEVIRTLALYVRPFVKSEYFEVLNNALKYMIRLKCPHAACALTLTNMISGIAEAFPNTQEAALMESILGVLRHPKLTSIKPAVQALIGDRTSECIADFVEKSSSHLEKHIFDLYAVYESILVSFAVISPVLMKSSIGLLEEVKKAFHSVQGEYMLELLFSFIGKHVAQHLECIEQYDTLIKECFQQHLALLAKECEDSMEGPNERTIRTLNTELFAAINAPDANKLYLQIMESTDEVLRQNKSVSGLAQSIIPLESTFLTGVISHLKTNLHLGYALIRLHTAHVLELSNSLEISQLFKWIPVQEPAKSLFAALLAISACEKAATADKNSFESLSENAFTALKTLVGKLEPQSAIEAFAKIMAIAYNLEGETDPYFELSKYSEVVKGVNKVKPQIVKPADKLKFMTLLVSLADSCIGNERIIEKCATELPVESSMSIFAPGYTLLVLLYYKVAKAYKTAVASTALMKLHRALIRNIKATIDLIESMLSKVCTCELARILLKWRIPEAMKATTRILKIAVDRTSGTKGWNDVNARIRFKAFLGDVVEEIMGFVGASSANNSSKDVLRIQLLVAISTNAVTLGMKECEEMCTEQVPKAMESLLENEAIKSPLLFTTVYLCYSALFKKYATEMVLHTETLVNHIKKSLSDAGKMHRNALQESEEFHTSSTIIASCLKTLLSLTETVPHFLDSYASSIIKSLILLPAVHSETQLRLGQALGKNVPTKAILLGLAENYEQYQRLDDSTQVRNFLAILESSCQNATTAYIAANYGSVFDLFLILFPYAQFYYDLHKMDHVELQSIERYLLSAFAAFVVKLNGHQFKDVFLGFVKWAQKAEGSISDFPYNLRRCMLFIKAVNKLADETLHSLFIPYLAHYQQFLIELLNLTAHKSTAELEFNKISHSLLMKLATEHVRTLFEKDTDQTIENDTFQELVVPLAGQAEIAELGKEYVKKVLAKCLVVMVDRINSEEAWKYAFNIILMKTRSEEAMVRLNAITIMAQIVGKMQDKLLGLLSDIAPFAAECLEDENDEVVSEAKKLLQTFEQITGESIDKFLRQLLINHNPLPHYY